MSTPTNRTKVVETRPRVVEAADGTEVSRATIMAMRNTQRWTAKKKQRVTAAIVHGVVSLEEAVDIVPFSSVDEWRRDIELYNKYGLEGLKVGPALQKVYRD